MKKIAAILCRAWQRHAELIGADYYLSQVRSSINVCLVVLTPYAALNFLYWQNSRIIGVIQVLTIVFLLIPAAWISRTSKNRNLAGSLLMLAVFMNMMILLVHGDAGGMNLLLINSFPFLIFLINKHGRAWVYSLAFIAINFLYLFLILDNLVFGFHYDYDVRFQFILSLIFYTLIAASMSQLRSNFEKRLHDRVEEKTLAAKNLLTELQFIATHDSLTKLPNRSQLLTIITKKMDGAHAIQGGLIACNLRVERLFEIGNVLGESGADDVVYAVAEKLRNLCSENTILAHIRRDEFVIIDHQTNDIEMSSLIRRVICESHFMVRQQGHDFLIELTLGLASFPSHAHDARQLLNRAEQAMLHARANYLQYSVYDSELELNFVRHQLLFGKLREALRLHQLEIYYQPQIDMSTGTIVGVEALMRWHDPVDGPISPNVFIPVAEESGLIHLLTKWLIFQCMRQGAAWQKMGYDLNISINISSRNLLSPDLLEHLKEAMQETCFAPHLFTIEITESCVLSSPERSLEVISAIHATGIMLSIDDFGTGYSSLAYLKNLPISELKIDKSFVKNLVSDSDDQAIVISTIDLAHNFGLTVVAEGIENEQTISWLRSRGCDLGQGYHIKHPIAAHEFSSFLQQSKAGLHNSPNVH